MSGIALLVSGIEEASKFKANAQEHGLMIRFTSLTADQERRLAEERSIGASLVDKLTELVDAFQDSAIGRFVKRFRVTNKNSTNLGENAGQVVNVYEAGTVSSKPLQSEPFRKWANSINNYL
ncbi:hypothetical protein CCR75_008857 [Bremia lactucae]|uniref:Uncharacterized protein n=1 Tax=Bremia lactucae TaxID=4779 RepID=A0A976FLZ2_BRELC|nr:hypothetical protein CCR75_008857 [Bremia lactucae]